MIRIAVSKDGGSSIWAQSRDPMSPGVIWPTPGQPMAVGPISLGGIAAQLDADEWIWIGPSTTGVQKSALRLEKLLAGQQFEESKHPRHPKGSKGGGRFAPKHGSTGMVMVSPNREEGTTMQRADEKLRSLEQRRLVAAERSILQHLKIDGAIHTGIGAWSDGAENTTLIEAPKNTDLDTLAAAACLAGTIAEQKAVIAFASDPKGPDRMYRLSAQIKPKDLHDALINAGVEFHTLIAEGNTTHAYVYTARDFGIEGQLAVAHGLRSVQEATNGTVEFSRGNGKFIGADDRAEGVSAQQKFFDKFTRTGTRRAGAGNDLRRYAQQLRDVWDSSQQLEGAIDRATVLNPQSGKGRTGGRSKKLDQPRPEDSDESKSFLSETESKAEGRSSVDLMKMDDAAAKAAIGVGAGKNIVAEVYKVLGDRTAEAYSRIEPDIDEQSKALGIERGRMFDHSVKVVAKAMTAELVYSLATPAIAKYKDWYTEKYGHAVAKVAEEHFPEVATDQAARARFDVCVAIASDGATPEDNVMNTLGIYEQLRDGVPIEKIEVTGRRAKKVKGALEAYGRVLERFSGDALKAREWMLAEVRAGDFVSSMKAAGLKVSDGYAVDMMVPRAALLLGPKLGAFYANLSGRPGYLTSDLWWNRSVNRIRGTTWTPTPTGPQSSYAKFLGMTGQGTSLPEVIEAAKPYQQAYEDRNWSTMMEVEMGSKEPTNDSELAAWRSKALKKFGPVAYATMLREGEIEKTSNTIVKNGEFGIQEDPYGKDDRSFQVAVAHEVIANLAAQGHHLQIAQLQALEWVYEQTLATKLSGKDLMAGDFAEAMETILPRYKSRKAGKATA